MIGMLINSNLNWNRSTLSYLLWIGMVDLFKALCYHMTSCVCVSPILLPSTDYVLDSLITTGQLDEENRDKVRIALLQRHRHHGHKEHDKNFLEQIKSLGDIGRIHSSNKNLDEEDGDGAQGNTMQGTSRFPFSAPNLLNLPKMFGAGGRHSIGRNGNGRKNSNGGNGKNSNENVARKTSWNGSAERADGGSRLEEECHSGSEEDLSKRAKVCVCPFVCLSANYNEHMVHDLQRKEAEQCLNR